MVGRWNSTAWYWQEWNHDNKVTRVYGNGQDIRYSYDADGQRVWSVDRSSTTVYAGEHYEVTNGAATSYYYFGGQRVAMRDGIWTGQVFWLHGDHLGSVSLVTTAAGATSGNLRYRPYGETRSAAGNIYTEYRFTGQRSFAGVGLYDYSARMYSPILGRFISPDSIVPRLQDSQSLNRYGCARHSPMTRIDPTGHADFPFGDDDDGPFDCDNVLDCFGAGPQLAPMLGR